VNISEKPNSSASISLGPRWHLAMNTLAFTVCFASWTMNGVLVTFLVGNGLYKWDAAQMGWLMGIPVLSGALLRLPVGAWTDKYGGRIVYSLLLLIAAIPMYLMSMADNYTQFFLASLGFGMSGASFAIGIAYTSVWFSKERQGLALGIFGVGNAGAAVTSLGAPILLGILTQQGANLEAWRELPKIYALTLAIMAVLFFLFTRSKRVEHAQNLTIIQQLKPLKYLQVWRFGLYYFLVFGGFVALSQWLIPYYTNVYAMPLATAGFLAMLFSLPSGVIRAAGGWMADKWGGRVLLYWIFAITLVVLALLIVPPMDIYSPGGGMTAAKPGTVTEVTSSAIVLSEGQRYELKQKPETATLDRRDENLILPVFTQWHESVVKEGDKVVRRQLLAQGITYIYFQANVWIFVALIFIVGITTGLGKAAVYKLIPDYFPRDIGVVGGLVGLIGALGGFLGPIIFGYVLKWTGIWTTTWLFLGLLTLASLIVLKSAVKRGYD